MRICTSSGVSAIILAAILAVSGPALAAGADAKPVSPSEFRQFAEGHTLYFEYEGESFGAEAFEPGGQTLWRYGDGTCTPGAWRAYGAQLCFYYGDGTDVQCWRLMRDEAGLFVRLLGSGEDAGMELRISGRDQRRPLCSGPAEGA